MSIRRTTISTQIWELCTISLAKVLVPAVRRFSENACKRRSPWQLRNRVFIQLINARHELASTKGFEEWGSVLGDEVMAAALIDRVLHHCHIVNIRGNSYRMRRHAELSKAIHPTAARALSA